MYNIVFGSITVAVCTAVYFLSWKYFIAKKTGYAVLMLVFCGFLLRIFTGFDLYIHPWDEMLHALVAKNLLKHPLLPTLYENPLLPFDFRNWLGNHVWVHKQPLPLWSIASSLYVFGIREIAIRIPSIIMTTGGVALTYYIGRYFFNKSVGYFSAFLYSVNGLIIEISSGRIPTDHVDAHFLFFIQLSIFFAILFSKKDRLIYNILCGISIGAAILCKWLPALIVVPIWILIVLKEKKLNYKQIAVNTGILLFFIFITFLPWQIYTAYYFSEETQYSHILNIRHITEALDNQGGPFYFYLDGLRIHYGELIYIPVLWFLWKTLNHRKNYRYLAITIWFAVPYIFFSIVQTKMKGFTLFASPAIFMMNGLFFYYLKRYRYKFRHKWVINTFLILTVLLAIRYSIERIKPFQDLDRNPIWAQNLKELKYKYYGKTVLFNTSHPLEAMFYNDITAYKDTPDKQTIKRLIDEGYTVLINNKEKLPPEYKNLDKIIYLELE